MRDDSPLAATPPPVPPPGSARPGYPGLPQAPRAPRARRARTLRAVVALLLREMSSTYGRSPGGYVWALLEPAGAIAVFTLVVASGLRIRNPSIGISFELFFATGVLLFLFYQRTATRVAQAISYSRALLQYPAVTYVDAILARFALQLLTHSTVIALMMGFILLVIDHRTNPELGPVVVAMAMAAALGLGMGVLNAYLFPTFPLWRSVFGIITTPMFFLSTIFYTYEDLPALGRAVLWYNPLVHIIGMCRRGIYDIYDAPWVSPLYVFGLAGILMLAGFILLGRYYRYIANEEFD